MKTEKPLVDRDYLLVRIGIDKGGWTVAKIPEIPMPKAAFGMLKVKGRIDDYEFSNINLMPMGNGNIGLAVKSAVRKRIKKHLLIGSIQLKQNSLKLNELSEL